MDERENLIELIFQGKNVCQKTLCCECKYDRYEDCAERLIAEHLIANGVMVQELDGCIRCKDSQQMTVMISNKLVDGVNTGWLGGNLPAKFCPFCGRSIPQPPKGE